MKISFDLDDTLFIDSLANEIEKPLSFPFNLFFKENLRKGTIELFKQLKANGHEIWIYTTSFRSKVLSKMGCWYFVIPALASKGITK